jgi:hypothetical protein
VCSAELGHLFGGDPPALDDHVEHGLSRLEPVAVCLGQLAH